MTASACGCTSSPCSCSSAPCGCCEGTQQLTPASECNRPGLEAIRYRVGTHGQFIETMKARLSTITVDGVEADGQTVTTFRPLVGLTTRDSGDPSIALLDCWACVGNVLSFYQERIANEGFLRTATERRSVLELSRLIGYTLRPGVASTVYLAYTVDDKQLEPVTIAAGARSQSVPGPGELPQSFETSDDLEARAAWNTFRPRMSRPQINKTSINKPNVSTSDEHIYLKGTNTNLKVNDPLLIDPGDGTKPSAFRVLLVQPDAASERTLVTLSPLNQSASSNSTTSAKPTGANTLSAGPAVGSRTDGTDPAIEVIACLTVPPSIPPRGASNLPRSLGDTFTAGADIAPQIVTSLQPLLQGTLVAALANQPAAAANRMHVYALRVKAAPFGNIAPLKVKIDSSTSPPTVTTSEWTITDMGSGDGTTPGANETTNAIYLDAAYDKIPLDSWLVIDTSAVDWSSQVYIQLPPAGNLIVTKANAIDVNSARAAYGMTGKTTQVGLTDAWFAFPPPPQIQAVLKTRDATSTDNSFQLIRRTAVYAQAEELALVDEPIGEDISQGADSWIELDGYYSDLKSGRWVVVSGERADVVSPDPNSPGTQVAIPGIPGSELVMLSNVIQDVSLPDGTPLTQSQSTGDAAAPPLPGERNHTFIRFAKNLQYRYRRDKVTIYGNVVKATHGETRNEVLGNGDGSKVLQSFTLKQPPLTFVAAPTPVGAASTLHAYVNDVEWHETESLAWLGPKDRGFVTQTDDAGSTTLTFGDGEHGVRLPTGLLNVRAVYRNGIGNIGNVRAEQISLLQTRPLGVKAVINPMRASGGGDKESRDLARANAPLSVMPLDRLVSVQDYADFTRRFAGIAKALAQKTSDGQKQLLYLTIAGVDDAPIDVTSDLYLNLLEALRDFGDPDLPLRIDLRELLILILSAKIKTAPDYLWEPVVTAVRARLLDVFGFGKRGLGQWALISEVISAIQNVAGVAYVDVDTFGAISEKIADMADGKPIRRLRTPREIIDAAQKIVNRAAQLGGATGLASRDRLACSVMVWPGGSDHGVLVPAGLAIFSPTIPDTLILNQIR
jgi:hypothetical protein